MAKFQNKKKSGISKKKSGINQEMVNTSKYFSVAMFICCAYFSNRHKCDLVDMIGDVFLLVTSMNKTRENIVHYMTELLDSLNNLVLFYRKALSYLRNPAIQSYNGRYFL